MNNTTVAFLLGEKKNVVIDVENLAKKDGVRALRQTLTPVSFPKVVTVLKNQHILERCKPT